VRRGTLLVAPEACRDIAGTFDRRYDPICPSVRVLNKLSMSSYTCALRG
jgi:hypothetical protein